MPRQGFAERSASPLLLCLLISTAAVAGECDSLASLSIPDTEIVAATRVEAGAFEQPGGGRFARFANQAYAALPAFCRVEAVSRPAPGSEIGIEVWLPSSGWNEKLEGVGNGAWAGSISYSAMASALAAGYAVASTDTGHRGGSVDFARETARLIDFANRAVHEMTIVAKAVTEAFYERPQSRAYFAGCSTGGRQALTEAQRYPFDYDGIVAGAPAYYPSHIQGMQVFTAAVSNRSDAARLDADDLALVNSAAIASCDLIDGVGDGVIEDPRQCGFDPAALACRAGSTDACLNPEQIETVRRVYAGPTDSDGRNIFPGLSRGSEAGWATLSGPAPLSLALETYNVLVYNDPEWDWRAFDAERDIATAATRIGSLMDASDADLTAFIGNGGKLILYHGWSDPGIPPAGTIRYYEAVLGTVGARDANDAVRLFMVPGMNHCSGGTGTDRFDAVSALDTWIASDTPPASIPAERQVGGEVVRTRPLCPYPSTAVYDGKGNTDDASSFSCQ